MVGFVEYRVTVMPERTYPGSGKLPGQESWFMDSGSISIQGITEGRSGLPHSRRG
jgi:hypothetical protein